MVLFTLKSCAAFIFRSPCKSEGLFINIYSGRYLNSSSSSCSRKTAEDCEAACILDHSCKSINLEDNGNCCELLSKVIGEKGGTLVNKTGWMHKSTDYQTYNVSAFLKTINHRHLSQFIELISWYFVVITD